MEITGEAGEEGMERKDDETDVGDKPRWGGESLSCRNLPERAASVSPPPGNPGEPTTPSSPGGTRDGGHVTLRGKTPRI